MSSFNALGIIYFIFAYLLCALPFGVLVSKLVAGRDVRSQGSGNIGATNVARLMGKKWGVFVLFLDALKGFMAVGLAKHVGPAWYCNLIAVVAVIAHCYPIYLKFKGGKGVATAFGALAALSWMIVGLCVLVFMLATALSRRISAGSLSAALSVPIFSVIFPAELSPIAAAIISGIVWWKHKENIKRLLARTEPKFF